MRTYSLTVTCEDKGPDDLAVFDRLLRLTYELSEVPGVTKVQLDPRPAKESPEQQEAQA